MRIVMAAVVALALFATSDSQGDQCSDWGARTGDCHTAVVEDDDVVLHGENRSGGESRGEVDDEGDDEGDAASDADTRAPEYGDSRDDYIITMPVVTLTDIARFRPSTTTVRMEPDGWAVAGLPANLYSDAAPQVVPGTLLGASADVRFTPVAYRWDYGDGTTADLTARGSSWASLGLREFAATPTSHTFTRTGTFTVRLGVVYRAEYRIASGPFVPIPGTLVRPAHDRRISVGKANTVLVDEDCTGARSAPGC